MADTIKTHKTLFGIDMSKLGRVTNVEIIDVIDADKIEVNDFISVDGEPVEVIAILDSTDPHEVKVKVYSHDTGDTKPVELPYDYSVELLGY